MANNKIMIANIRVLHYDEYGLHSYNDRKKYKCPYCNQTYTRASSEIIYKSDFNKMVFCSYNCRSKYYQEHWKERQEYRESHTLYANYERFKKSQRKGK